MTISIVIPMVPPDVNHYVRHTRAGHHYMTKEARAFKDAVAIMARGKEIRGDAYEIDITVYLGKGKRGDWDNFPKTVCDALQKAGTIDTDAKIKDGHVHVRRDRDNPRTEVTIKVIDSYE